MHSISTISPLYAIPESTPQDVSGETFETLQSIAETYQETDALCQELPLSGSVQRSLNTNLGLLAIQTLASAELHSDRKKQQLLAEMQGYNGSLKDISELIRALTERKAQGKADFSEPQFRDLIDRVRESNRDPHTQQSVVPDYQYNWPSESSIDITLQGLNDRVKIIGQELNQIMMGIEQEYKDMDGILQAGRELAKLIQESIRSIQSRTGR
ncbi:MAG: hypothetical protein NTZ52_02425 [Chlamydiae bacterium]|nr:hypothetical protein [Chlamydiota bacterium]